MNKITILPGDTFTFISGNAALCVYRRGESLHVVHSTGSVHGAVGGIRLSGERDITRADVLVLLRVYGVEVVEETPMPVVKVTHGVAGKSIGEILAVGDERACNKICGLWGTAYELVRLDFGGAA